MIRCSTMMVASTIVALLCVKSYPAVVNHSGDAPGFGTAILGLPSTTIDFESLSEGEIITTQFEPDNVRFIPVPGQDLIASNSIYGNILPGGTLAMRLPLTEPPFVRAEFVQPVRGFSFQLIDQDLPASFDVFDPNDQLLATFGLTPGGSPDFVAALSDVHNIGSIELTGGLLNEGLGIDDFRMVSIIPLPASSWLGLALLGGLGLIGMRRTRMRAA